MSIIIEEFDKSKNCYFCPFNNSDCYCNLTGGFIDRDDWDCSVTCPIKEIPKGHGKIVDVKEADLINHLYAYIFFNDACKFVDSLPSILEKEMIEARKNNMDNN